MIPHHVQTLADYRTWFADELEQSGGHLLDHDPLIVTPADLGITAHGTTEDLLIPPQRLGFVGGTRLLFDCLVRAHTTDGEITPDGEGIADFEHVRYRFHASGDHGPIWRLDKHADHGTGPAHIHLPPAGRRRRERVQPTVEYDVAMVIDRLRAEGHI